MARVYVTSVKLGHILVIPRVNTRVSHVNKGRISPSTAPSPVFPAQAGITKKEVDKAHVTYVSQGL